MAGQTIRSRGAAGNPPNRFEQIVLERDADWNPDEDPLPSTRFYRDLSQTIITRNDSPDIPFRSEHESLPRMRARLLLLLCAAHARISGLFGRAGFRDQNHGEGECARAAEARAFLPEMETAGAGDERRNRLLPARRTSTLQLTRRCLAVLAEFRNPVSIITKNALVTRDLDLLRELAAHRAVHVNISITTLDSELARKLEPRAASPRQRLAAIETLSKAGVPGGGPGGAGYPGDQ